MMNRPNMYLHQRAEVRLRVRANAAIRFAGQVSHCGVRNLSAGGAEVYTPKRVPPVGGQVELTVSSEGAQLGPLAAEVVRCTQYGVAFRFLGVDTTARRRILDAIARM